MIFMIFLLWYICFVENTSKEVVPLEQFYCTGTASPKIHTFLFTILSPIIRARTYIFIIVIMLRFVICRFWGIIFDYWLDYWLNPAQFNSIQGRKFGGKRKRMRWQYQKKPAMGASTPVFFFILVTVNMKLTYVYGNTVNSTLLP